MAWFSPDMESKLTANFTWHEAVCRHCGRIPDETAVRLTAQWLERVRAEIFGGRPIHINSWCRCPEYNATLPGAARHSMHLLGKAADITVHGLTPFQVWFKLRWSFWGKNKLIKGLGKYPAFTHIDRREFPAKWGGGD